MISDKAESNLLTLQHSIETAKNWPRKADRSIVREGAPHVFRGWLLPFLVSIDDALWGRWDYWARTKISGRLLDEPLPRISFGDFPMSKLGHSPARRMLENALNHIPSHGEWQTWGSTTYIDYFFDWMLYGFGYHAELPEAPIGCEGACSRLYQTFCLDAMQAYPYDYFGDMLAETSYGRGQGFYPTPMHVCEMMTQMLYGEGDSRALTINEPCVGTGRMLMCASNFSMCLFGQDIMLTSVKATIINLYLYAPWGAKPMEWMIPEREEMPERTPLPVPRIAWKNIRRHGISQAELILT